MYNKVGLTMTKLRLGRIISRISSPNSILDSCRLEIYNYGLSFLLSCDPRPEVYHSISLNFENLLFNCHKNIRPIIYPGCFRRFNLGSVDDRPTRSESK